MFSAPSSWQEYTTLLWYNRAMPEEQPVLETVAPETPPAAEQPSGAAPESAPQLSKESMAERVAERASEAPQERAVPQQPAGDQAAPAAASRPPVMKDQVTREVEQILSNGLEPFYASLPPEGKAVFRQKGEQISQEITTMVRSLSVQVKRVLELIYHWLKVIPGVNKFFLEQEAKIKTDQIIQYTEDLRKRSEHERGV
jgi:hypothetical protein